MQEDDKPSVCERVEEAKSDANLEPEEGVKMNTKYN